MATKSILFVDVRVRGYLPLLAGLLEGTEVFFLDPELDGVSQIADYMTGRSGYDSIHILSHGGPGSLYLGNGVLDGVNLSAYTEDLARIGQALTPTGDILLYGCEVAQGEEGQAFIEQFAVLTGAEVAASIDLTGSAELGGDWLLEATTGPVESVGLDGSGLADTVLGMLSTPIRLQFPGHTNGEWRNVLAFAALRADGSVVTWGDSSMGGDSSSVASLINGDVTQVFSTQTAFAALREDGSVVTWGDSSYGGDSNTITNLINGDVDVTQIFSTEGAFAALREDGSVVTWGDSSMGGNSSSVASLINGDVDVTQIFSTGWAFAALREDGSVITWGDSSMGGDSSDVASLINGDVDVTQIFSTGWAFAALREDGSVVTWGDSVDGGDSSFVASLLNGDVDVTQVFSTDYAFAALKADGSVVTWGRSESGGDSSSVASQLDGGLDVTHIFSTWDAFAALRADGSVVTWGWPNFGGDSSDIASLVNGDVDVIQIFSTGYAFAALRADGSVVTWGNSTSGGDSSGVASQLVNVVGMAEISTNDVYTVIGPADTTAPTVNSFNPADEAHGVTVSSNIVVTFSEAIQRGTGDIALKTAAGTVVETFNAATSTNISISSSTLIINPTADLASDSVYKVEFAAGTIKDLAGNSFIGTTSYNFTTNYAPTGTVTITGTAIQGQTLTAGNTLADPDGLGTISYQWQANGSNISGATGTTLTLNQDHVGKTITVTAGYTDSHGTVESVSSSSTDLVAKLPASPLSLTGTAGNDLMAGGEGDDTIIALGGNDFIKGMQGDDFIDGGDGLDTAIFSGQIGDYNVTKQGNNVIVDGPDGFDTLVHVERLIFDDYALAFDIDDNAGQAYRLYQAAFDREPDKGGLGYWINHLDQGLSLQAVATGFIGSNEFKGLYGPNPSNEAFVNLLYQNVLNRQPDAGGEAYWLNHLSTGMTREMVLIGFSESAENQTAVQGRIESGILYATAEINLQGLTLTGTDNADNLIGSFLDDTLNGLAGNDTLTGLAGNDILDGGTGIDTAIFSASLDAYEISRVNENTITVADQRAFITLVGADHGDGTDTLINIERLQFSDQTVAFDIDGNAGQTYRLYQAAFDREPDKGGLGYWINHLDQGLSLQAVATGFIGSNEFKGLYGPNPSNEAFVNLLYQNVLNRQPDAGGEAYWLNHLSTGMTREMVLIGFSESGENQVAVIGVIQDGIEFYPI